jgi:hypothetical protein
MNEERYFKVYNELMATKLVDSFAVKVYAVISSFTLTGKEKCFRGSNAYLAIVTGMNEGTVKKKLRILRERNWVISNNKQNELRRLWAVPVKKLIDLQDEYKTRLESIAELRKVTEKEGDLLEEFLKEQDECKAAQLEGGETSQQLGGSKTSKNARTDHNDTSDENRKEISNETIDETIGNSKLLFDLPEGILRIEPRDVVTSNEISADLKFLHNIIDTCKSHTDLVPALEDFVKHSNRKVVWFGPTDGKPVDFYLMMSAQLGSCSFDREKYLVINGVDGMYEIVSHYVQQ